MCIADDGSRDPAIGALLSEFALMDPRIKVFFREANGHISAATNSALTLAGGSWVASMDHDDEIPEHALAVAVLALAHHPGATMLYSDEDKIDLHGQRHGPFFKPEFDPLLLLGQNYLCHLTMIRTDLVRGLGGYREGFEGSQDSGSCPPGLRNGRSHEHYPCPTRALPLEGPSRLDSVQPSGETLCGVSWSSLGDRSFEQDGTERRGRDEPELGVESSQMGAFRKCATSQHRYSDPRWPILDQVH